MSTTAEVLTEVALEREAQDRKFPNQHLPNGTGGKFRETVRGLAQMRCDEAAEAGLLTWDHVLYEELYEALAEASDVRLRKELIQVAAVAVRWVEDIDLRRTE